MYCGNYIESYIVWRHLYLDTGLNIEKRSAHVVDSPAGAKK